MGNSINRKKDYSSSNTETLLDLAAMQDEQPAKDPSKAKPFEIIHDFIKQIRKGKRSPEEVAASYGRHYTPDTKFMILSKEVQLLLPNISLKSVKVLELFGIVPSDAFSSGRSKERLYEFFPSQYIKGTMVNSPSYANFEDRMEFAFKMHDSDGDGKISSEDLKSTLSLYSQESEFKLDSRAVQELVTVIFQSLNKEPEVPITYEEFIDFFQVYRSRSIKVDCFDKAKAPKATLTPQPSTLEITSPVLYKDRPSDPKPVSKVQKWKNRVFIDRAKWTWLFLWLCGLIAFFVTTYMQFSDYAPIAIAKSCAAVIRYNMFIMLALVTKSFTTLLRKLGFVKILPLNYGVYFHTTLAFATLIAAWIHTIMHLAFVLPLLSSFKTGDDLNDFLNQPKRFQEPKPYSYWIASLPSWTGIASIIIMTVMVILAIKKLRKQNYERFWYTHAFWLALIVLLSIHGFGSLLSSPQFSYYIIGPTIIIIVEKIFRRLSMAGKGYKIENLAYLDSEVIELKVSKPKNYKFIPGQYARINIPQISYLQWHPFSFSSSQNEEHLSFHISPVGDWTNNLKEIALDHQNNRLSKIHVTGPNGAPSQHYCDYKNIMIISSGVGATPFASIMRDLAFKSKQDTESTQAVKSIEFFWVNRKPSSQTWLNSLFMELQNDEKCKNLLKIHIYLTKPHQKYDLRSLLLWRGLEILHSQNKQVKGLEHFNLIRWGRPDWDEVFRRASLKVKEGAIGVFYCGNDPLAEELHQKCVDYSNSKLKFDFFKEIF